jgi:hypothetical protein
MQKNCPSRKVVNPVSKRCVKADGRIGKKVLGTEVKIIFRPEIYEIWSSHFEDNSVGSSIGNYIWKSLDTQNYVEWYNQFLDAIQKRLKNTDIYVSAFSRYRNRVQFKLIGKSLKNINIERLHKIIDNKLPKGSLLSDLEKKLENAISYAFAPDSHEDHFIIHNHTLYSIEKNDDAWRIKKK